MFSFIWGPRGILTCQTSGLLKQSLLLFLFYLFFILLPFWDLFRSMFFTRVIFLLLLSEMVGVGLFVFFSEFKNISLLESQRPFILFIPCLDSCPLGDSTNPDVFQGMGCKEIVSSRPSLCRHANISNVWCCKSCHSIPPVRKLTLFRLRYDEQLV